VKEKSETVLIESVLAGDIDSFGELGRRYWPAMVAIAYAILGDHHLAEDAAQEALARALVGLGTLKNRDKFGSWLARICRNVAKDMAFDKSRRLSDKDLSQLPDGYSEDESSGEVRQAIGKLGPRMKELVVLRYYNNLSYEQISSVLGISKAAINGRLSRAKRKIAMYLRQMNLSDDS
jgi:RNA polymerase sigma-70 factor (ECF subfamily)